MWESYPWEVQNAEQTILNQPEEGTLQTAPQAGWWGVGIGYTSTEGGM